MIVGGIYIPKACDSIKPEYEYSNDLKAGKKAYVDIVSLSPKFTVSKNSSSINQAIVCKCKTKDGETLWMYMKSNEYSMLEGSRIRYSSYPYNTEYDDIQFKQPVRIHGRISNEDKLKIIGLTKKTNSNTIFVFESVDSN